MVFRGFRTTINILDSLTLNSQTFWIFNKIITYVTNFTYRNIVLLAFIEIIFIAKINKLKFFTL